MDKFGRTFTLTVQGETGAFVRIATPLTIDFMIEMANLQSLGLATFQVRNLAKATRNLLYKDPFAFNVYPDIEFRAGYGNNQPLIYKGTVQQASSYRMSGSVDFITQIDCFMGSVGAMNNYVSKAISGPVSQLQVIDALIESMAPLQKGYVSPAFNKVYPRGRSLCFNSWRLLQIETGYRCFVSNGRIYVMGDGEPVPGAPLVVSAATGLLGTPRRNKQFIEFEMIFEPRVTIGQPIELLSLGNSYLNGIYYVTGIQHSGTISEAVGGSLKTKISAYIGANVLSPALGAAA